MINLITIIIILVIVVSRLLGKYDIGKNIKKGFLWDEIDDAIKKVKADLEKQIYMRDKTSKKQPEMVQTFEIEDLKENFNESMLKDDDYVSPDFEIVQEDNAGNTIKVQMEDNLIEYEKEIVEYNLSFTDDDILKAIIFKEILDKPLCKRNV
jgi:hypothetical protein